MKAFAFGIVSVVLAGGLAAQAEEQGSFDKSLTVSGPVDLEVKTDSGGISVTQGSAGVLKIHAILKSQHGWFGSGDAGARIAELTRNPPVEQTGNRIRVGYVRDPALLRGISMRLEIQTPTHTQIRARADSGGIRIEGISGPVDSKTDSGGIDIRDISSDVRAAADSGGIHIGNIKGAVFARVDSGGIEASDVAGAIDAEADSGSIQLRQTKAAPIRAKADSGGVTARLAPGAGYDVSAQCDSGHISVPEMTVKGAFSRHHVEGKVHGGGPLVDVRVDSGGISIQ